MAERLDPSEAAFPHGHTSEELSDEELAKRVAEAADGSGEPKVTEPVDDLEAAEESERLDEEAQDWADEPVDAEVVEDGDEPPAAVVDGPEASTGKRPTRYVVLEAVKVQIGGQDGEMWREVGEFDGPHPRDRAHGQLGGSHGALVAVPVRSWKPKRPVEKPRPPVVGWE